jgi:hypothetical protein
MHEVNVQRAVRAGARKAGLTARVTPHVLRHHAATVARQRWKAKRRASSSASSAKFSGRQCGSNSAAKAAACGVHGAAWSPPLGWGGEGIRIAQPAMPQRIEARTADFQARTGRRGVAASGIEIVEECGDEALAEAVAELLFISGWMSGAGPDGSRRAGRCSHPVLSHPRNCPASLEQ